VATFLYNESDDTEESKDKARWGFVSVERSRFGIYDRRVLNDEEYLFSADQV
jgi:hypothetical protein